MPSKCVFGVMTQAQFSLPSPTLNLCLPFAKRESQRFGDAESLQRLLQVAMQSGQGGAQIWEPQAPTRTYQLFLARAFQTQPT